VRGIADSGEQQLRAGTRRGPPAHACGRTAERLPDGMLEGRLAAVPVETDAA
jgi:hypothetical protein